MLWDLLPERTCLGGAPANFAYITTLMGDQGIVASRVGEDSRGLEALRRMEELGLNIDHVQTDREHPTGTVNVELDAKGRRGLKLRIRWPGIFCSGHGIGSSLPKHVDAVCFGSLAQRSEESRATIRRFLTPLRRTRESLRRQPPAVLLLGGSSVRSR